MGGSATFSLGNREKPLHNPAKGDVYFKSLDKIMNNYVVLYDVQSKQAWLVHAIQALLHLTQAYLRTIQLDGGTPILTISGEHPPENVDADTALQLLRDHGNMRTEVGQSGEHTKRDDPTAGKDDDMYHLRDIVVDRLEKLEQIIGHISDRRSQTSVGYRIRISPVKQLVGYDFMQIVEENTHVDPMVTTLESDGRGWVEFVRWIDAPVLFGRDFGDLLRPTPKARSSLCSYCHWNCDAPQSREILSVSISVLEHLVQRRGEKLEKSWRLVEDFHLDIPDHVFSDCRPGSHGKSHESRIRKLTKRGHKQKEARASHLQGAENQVHDGLNRPLAGILIGTPHKTLRKDPPKGLATTISFYRGSREYLAPDTTNRDQQPLRQTPSLPDSTQTWTLSSSMSNKVSNGSTNPSTPLDPSGDEQAGPVKDRKGKGREVITPDFGEWTIPAVEESQAQNILPSRHTTGGLESASGPSSRSRTTRQLNEQPSNGEDDLAVPKIRQANSDSVHEIDLGLDVLGTGKLACRKDESRDAGQGVIRNLGQPRRAGLSNQRLRRRFVHRTRSCPVNRGPSKHVTKEGPSVPAGLARDDHDTGLIQARLNDRGWVLLVVLLGFLVIAVMLLLMLLLVFAFYFMSGMPRSMLPGAL